ncbi:hypothetical protein DL98DRAFT_652286 [Cadophora sp. DSE1049]|nr:hypothetical protein DL98DRAFT_652286 [Cadophora sp. DSE1049]
MDLSAAQRYAAQVKSGLSSLGIDVSGKTEKVIEKQHVHSHSNVTETGPTNESYDITCLKFSKETGQNIQESKELLGIAERLSGDLVGIGEQFDGVTAETNPELALMVNKSSSISQHCMYYLEATSSNDSHVSFSAFNNQGYEDIANFFPLPFDYNYDNSNLFGSSTNLGELPTSPSLAIHSPFFLSPDNPPIERSGEFQWNSSNSCSPHPSSHQVPRPATSADAGLLSSIDNSTLTAPTTQHDTIASSQHEVPQHHQEPSQAQARTTSPDTPPSAFKFSESSPDIASDRQNPSQQKSTRSRPRGKKDKQLKCDTCFKVFPRRCDLKATTAHSDATLLAAPIPKALLYAKIFAGTSIPSTARALSLAIFQAVEKLSQDLTTVSDTSRSSIPMSSKLKGRLCQIVLSVIQRPESTKAMTFIIAIDYGATFMGVQFDCQPPPNVDIAMDVITEPNSPPSPPFHAKEEHQHDTATSSYDEYNDFLLFESAAYETNFDPGDPEMIWNSAASDISHQRQHIRAMILSWYDELAPDVLLNGRNVEWGSLGICNFHARIDRLFDRDYVWAATQTMVLFGTLAFWAPVAGKWH